MHTRLLRLLWVTREKVDQAARHSPARLALIVFAAVIGVFTLLLFMPAAARDGRSTPFVDALFTATSSVSVTGLVTVPTGEHWSGYGLTVIMVAMKIGGLGVMTMASLLGLAVSHRIGLTARLLAADETKSNRLGDVGSLIRVVVITSTSLELIIAAMLFPRFLELQEGVGEAAWHSLFYGISAFNNAGFVPTPDGLTPHVGDWLLGLPLIIGVVIGSLGFPVIFNLIRSRRRVSRWTLHTKLTLVTTGVLIAVGALVIGLLEWGNDETLGALPFGDRILAALFAGVMPRSGGFMTVDVADMQGSTWLFQDALMFVGGGSASTAGGIKVTTLAVMVLAIVAEARGDRDVDAFGRRLPRSVLRLAVAVSFLGASIVLVATMILLHITGWGLDVVLFEVVSAFGTAGLTTGVTGDLPESGKYVLAVLMYVGRTGTMTLAAALAIRERRRVIRYPEERPIVG